MNYLKLTQDNIDIKNIVDLVSSPCCGGISIFAGTTRDTFENKKVVSLEYEAYEKMALKVMEKICGEARKKWSVLKHIAMYHRLGLVPIKEVCVVIAVSSPHRKEAMESCQWITDQLKSSVPIWKKEIYENDEPTWKSNCEFIDLDSSISEQPIEPFEIPSHLIQIVAPASEVHRRIDAFIQLKREQVNRANIRDFCTFLDQSDVTCARTNPSTFKRKHTKSHLEVSRAFNSYKPKKDKLGTDVSNVLHERINSLEDYLKVPKPVPKDVYERIKFLEDRISVLESLSPEYATFWGKDIEKPKPVAMSTKISFTVDNIESLIKDLEDKTVKSDGK